MKNISKNISTVFLSFSILLLCYVFYRSQVFHNGTKFDYYLKYYVIASLCILLSFISFFIPKELKIKITIVIVSTIIGLYFVEGYLFIQYAPKLDQDNLLIYKNNTGEDYDKRNRFQIYQDLKKEDPNIVVEIVPSQSLSSINFLPLSGISNRKTIACNENGYYSNYQSDRYGFNNPDGEWDKDKIDYLLVGDSFTHGHCINEPDTISGNLKKLIGNKNGILNLGQAGNGPLIEYATLREYLPTKKVKRVLWLFFNGDLEELDSELTNQILVNYLKDKSFTQNLILRKQEIQKLLLKKFEQEVLKQKYYTGNGTRNGLGISIILSRFVKLNLIRKILFPSPTPPDPDPTKEFKNVLRLSNKFTKQNNSKLYFVYLPGHIRYTGKHNQGDLFNYKKVTEVVGSLNIPIIDLNKELFEKHKDPLSLFPFRKVGHYNELGYRLVAKIIFNKIKELEE